MLAFRRGNTSMILSLAWGSPMAEALHVAIEGITARQDLTT